MAEVGQGGEVYAHGRTRVGAWEMASKVLQSTAIQVIVECHLCIDETRIGRSEEEKEAARRLGLGPGLGPGLGAIGAEKQPVSSVKHHVVPTGKGKECGEVGHRTAKVPET